MSRSVVWGVYNLMDLAHKDMMKTRSRLNVVRYKKYLRADVWLDDMLIDCVSGRQLGAKVFMLVLESRRG